MRVRICVHALKMRMRVSVHWLGFYGAVGIGVGRGWRRMPQAVQKTMVTPNFGSKLLDGRAAPSCRVACLVNAH